MEDINDKVSNTYIIRRKLAELKPAPMQNHYEYYVGKFKVNIFVRDAQDHTTDSNDNIVRHATVSVQLYEVNRRNPDRALWDAIYMYRDDRFKNYEPIKYGVGNGRCDGGDMPINQLCELIRYLHKLEKLSAFA